MILSKRDAQLLLLIVVVGLLFAGAGVAVVAVRYVPVPDVAAVIGGLVLGTAATFWLGSREGLSLWAHRRKRAGRWVPKVRDWLAFQFWLAVGGMVTASVVAVVVMETL